MKINLYLFPFPYILHGEKVNGSILSWPQECIACKSGECEKAKSNSPLLCSYGFNYCFLPNNIITAGFVLREYPFLSPARKKRLREFGNTTISRKHLYNAIEAFTEYSETADKEIQKEKQRIIQEYIDAEHYKVDFLKPLREDIAKGLSFVHDYKQINAQIMQNLNVEFETKYSGQTIEDKLKKATPQEITIYKACKLLEEKLNVAKLLINPALMNRKEEYKRFRFHGVVEKYLHIYELQSENKGLSIGLSGNSHHEIIAHPEAIAVIPHTFLDNAIKYSAKSGSVDIVVQDENDSIYFEVSSYGPKIKPDEEVKIFQAFYRGEAARKQEEEGAGYGLYLSQIVAVNHLGSKIRVKQSKTQKPRFGHLTTFSLNIPLEATRV